jgi:predicted Zn-dependent peptidase
MTALDRRVMPPVHPDRAFRFAVLHRHLLANGLDVVIVERSSAPVVALLLLLRGGVAADPPDRPGLAGLTADLLDEGAGSRPSFEFHDALDRIGARLGIEIGPDATAVTLLVPSEHAEKGMALIADLAIRPMFSEADFRRVRDLRIARIHQLQDRPDAIADRAFAERLYGAHPYGHLSLGTEESLAGSVVDEVRRFHAARYGARTASLVVAGDIEAGRAARLASELFGSWAAGAPIDWTARQTMPAGGAASARISIVERAAASQSELRVGHVGVSRDAEDYYALVVLNMVLGGQFTSRLNLNLRQARGLTYSVRSAFDARRGPGPFVVQTSVQADGTATAIEQILAEMAALGGDRPATAEELRTAHAALTLGYARHFETAEQIARAVGQIALHNLGDDHVDRFVDNIRAVGVDDVARAAAARLHPAEALAVVVGDRDTTARM